MKILICNKWYHLQGGAERYLFALSDYLPQQGHQVVPFSVRYRQNRSSPFSPYFMSPPVNEDQPRIEGTQVSFGRAIKLAGRAIYSLEARRKIETLIQDWYVVRQERRKRLEAIRRIADSENEETLPDE